MPRPSKRSCGRDCLKRAMSKDAMFNSTSAPRREGWNSFPSWRPRKLVAAKVDVVVALYTPSARARATCDARDSHRRNRRQSCRNGNYRKPGAAGREYHGRVADGRRGRPGTCVEVFATCLPSVRKIAALCNASDPFMPLFLEKVAAYREKPQASKFAGDGAEPG